MTVQTEEGAQPLPGALVSLATPDRQVLGTALTDRDGQYLFTGFHAGPVVLQAETVGRETVVTGEIQVSGTQPVHHILGLPRAPLSLDGADARADDRCRLRPDPRLPSARLWEEVRKALTAVSRSESQGLYAYDIRSYERQLDARTEDVRSDTTRARLLLTRNPVRSPPREESPRDGYIRRLATGDFDYFAPDASTLLSPAFRRRHCVGLEPEGSPDGLVGLRFEPVRRDSVSDIAGVFWLDPATARLRRLEFRYTSLPWPVEDPRIGGTLHFEVLPNGGWLVRRWAIRMPIVQRDSTASGADGTGASVHLALLREVGLDVTSIVGADGTLIASDRGASVAGVVYDSTSASPLAGAELRISGTDHSAVSDSAGRFVFEGLPPGRYSVSLLHPRLDSLTGPLPPVPINVAGDTNGVRLAIPSPSTLWAAQCPTEAGGLGVLLGTVRDETSGAGLAQVHVSLDRQDGAPLTGMTDAHGRYLVCAVPADVPFRVRASVAGISSDVVETTVPERSWSAVTLVLPLSELAPAPQTAPARDVEPAVIRGQVVDAETGQAIPTADVSVLTLRGDTVTRLIASNDGTFRATVPDGGRYQVEARALGYADLPPGLVDVDRGQAVDVRVRLSVEAISLDQLVVTVQRRELVLDQTGFYDRLREGLGTFITPDQVQKREPAEVSDMLVNIPSTVLVSDEFGRRSVYFRGHQVLRSAVCWPRIVLDGAVVSQGGPARPANVDDLVDGQDLLAVEVYKRAAQIPPQYGGASTGCGVLVIWTKRGRGP